MAAKAPRRQGPNSLHTSARLMISPKPLPCPVNPPLLNSSRFWRRDKLLVSRNTCSPKSPESAERKRAPHVCALNDVQESDHAPCNTCKCPHLNCCDCSCLHIQQTPLSDASQDICKPPSRLDRPCVPIQQAETNHFLMRLGIHLQVHPPLIAFAFPSSRSRQTTF